VRHERQRIVVVATAIGSFILTDMIIGRLRRPGVLRASEPSAARAGWTRAVWSEAQAAMGSPVFGLRVRSSAALERAAVLQRDAAVKARRAVPRQRKATATKLEKH
jgi:hypothetical protein